MVKVPVKTRFIKICLLQSSCLLRFSVVILSIVYASNAAAVLVDLTGTAPEEITVTVTVSKPSNASNGVITLATYDADFSNEGELIINGNKAVPLFGSAGNLGNDANSADVIISTPASYWKNGNNTLRFIHKSTGGYIIDSVAVVFETGLQTSPQPSPLPSPAPPPEPIVNTPTPTSGSQYPVDLTGTAPEESTITVSVSKPSSAINGVLTLAVYDADISNEGELIINGNKAVPLFGIAGTGRNDSKSADVTISTPASYWKNGNNTLRFIHRRTAGYIIENVAVVFEAGSQTSPQPSPSPSPAPAPPPEPIVNTPTPTDGSQYPVDLTGTAPEESTITVSVSKPSSAINGVLTLAVYDADISNEGELIINGNKAVPLFGSAGVSGNDANSADVMISTPASYWRSGNNTLRFIHKRTAGYIVDNVTVVFETGSQTSAQPSPTPTLSSGTASVDLSWTAPTSRADGTALSKNEIAGYTVYYGTTKGSYPNSFSENNGSAVSTSVPGLQAGVIYYLVVTTRDTDGRESERSNMATRQAN